MTTKADNSTHTEHVVPIAGDYIHDSAGWDPKWRLLRNSDSHEDAAREGLLIEFNGGRYPFKDKKNGVKQKAIIEMLCDHDKSGLEGDEKDDRPKDDGRLEKRQDDGDEEVDEKKSLTFVSYGTEDGMGVLRLNWQTKYACEDQADNPDPVERGGWGFFTWFLIM